MTIKPEGRKMLRIEKKNAESPIEQKPRWIRNQVRTGPGYEDMKKRVAGAGLHTVCQEAGCPNIHECWESREATFLIGGDRCTRRCDFCDIATGKPQALDTDEPRRVSENIQEMNLNYATITGVTRDDLPDEGAWLYAEVVRKIHEKNPHTGVETSPLTSPASQTCCRKSSRLALRFSLTTWKPFLVFSSVSARHSVMSVLWMFCSRHTTSV